jgi:hypothetical protein
MTRLGSSTFETVLNECLNDIRTIRKRYPLMLPSGELPEAFREHAESLMGIGSDILAQLRPLLQQSSDSGLAIQALHFESYLKSYYDTCHRDTYSGTFGILQNEIDELRKAFLLMKPYLKGEEQGLVSAAKAFEERDVMIPTEIKESREDFGRDYPDPSNVGFIMMKFKENPAHERILKAIRSVLQSRQLTAVRSDDKQYHEDLYWNVLTYMHGCGFGIAVFDRIEEEEPSPNVSFETGYMKALRKNLCILKDKNLKNLHTDLLGKLYEPFDPQAPEDTIRERLLKWLSDKEIGTSLSAAPLVEWDEEEWESISPQDLAPEQLAMAKSVPPGASNVRIYRNKKDGSITIKYDEI